MPEAAKKKKTTKKKKITLPDSPTTEPGARVRTRRCSRSEAARLIEEHGFRLEEDLGSECIVWADQAANARFEAAEG